MAPNCRSVRGIAAVRKGFHPMQRLLTSLNSRPALLTVAHRLWNSLVLSGIILAIVNAAAQAASAADRHAAVRAQSEDAPADEEEEVDDPDDNAVVAAEKFKRSSRRKKTKPPEPSLFQSFQTSASGDGPGFIGQAGHLAFKTFGRNQSITPIEAMPYILTDEHFFFSDLRGFVSNSALFGGNAGAGYRHLREDFNAWFGASLWYDSDATTGRTYQQVGLSLEGLIDRFEFRSNIYVPISSGQIYSSAIGNERIVGNHLLYSRFIDQGKALHGVDLEAGYNLPVMENHRLRGFVGYYRFDGGPSGAVNGVKTRLEGVINNSVTAQVMFTSDPLFGSNVMFGCQFQFPWGHHHPTSKWKQNTPSPFRFVERNYNVIVDRAQTTENNLVAFNPQTHAAYKIEQVSSSAGPVGNGTIASPFQTIAAAQAAGGDVILVRGNSTLSTGATLTSGQFLLGDGSHQLLKLSGGGTLILPTQVVGGVTPQFNNVTGPAVILAAHSEFAGFKVANNNGNAVIGAGIAGSTIRDITFQNITGDAIRITNSTGDFVLNNINVNSTVGNGISFIGGAPNLTLSGSVTGSHGDGILLSGLTGGNVDIVHTSIQTSGGAGLNLSNVKTNVNVDSLTTTQTTGPAVSISGGTTTDAYHFTGTTTINQPNSTGFNVNNGVGAVTVDDLVINSTAASPAVSLTNSTGIITLSNLTATTSNAVGLYGRGLTSLVVKAGSLTTAGAGAVDVQNSAMNVNLSKVSTNGGPFGIRLMQNTGAFNLKGGAAYSSGGTIQNTVTGVILNSTGTVSISGVDLTTNGVAVQSTGNNQVTLNGLRIGGSTGYAIDSLDDIVLMVQNSIFAGNGALGAGTIRAHVDTLASYQWLFQGNNITDANGTAILLQTDIAGNGASLATTVQSNIVAGTRAGSPLVNINWFGPLSANVSTNILTAGAANMTGIVVKDSSTTDSVTAVVSNNALTFTDSMGTGILAAANAGSSFQVNTNTVDFKGVNGTGLRFNLGGISTTWIYSNIITDEADGATGMLFDNVAASSRLQIEANTVNLLSTDMTVRRGIIFNAVTPTIQFMGNYNNIITNTPTPFSIPVNAATGHIIINGSLVP